MNPRLNELSEKARGLTHSPGVYLMKNSKNEIIYIGKAKNLKNRVSGYFQPNNPSHNEKVKKMVENVYDFDYIVVDSEFEALVLECSLIKQNTPKYNILLKDDKGYSYIRISNEEYPKITAELQKLNDDATYLGPYTSSFSAKQAVEEANRIFMLPTCNKRFPDDFKKARPCLNFHIKRCMGVCKGRIDKKTYNEAVNEAVQYIKSGSTDLIERLSRQMEQAAENLEFEKAANLRDKISAIKKITDKQKVYMVGKESRDVVAFAQNNNFAAVAVLKFRGGQFVDKADFVFNEALDLQRIREEFLNRYYLAEEDIPQIIVLDEEIEGGELLESYLSDKLGRRVKIVVPQIGEQKKVVLMAFSNATEKLSKKVERTGREVAALDELRKLLNLKKTPEYIEAYDISNLGESAKVGGMVVFKNGRPYKKAYRKFKIKDVIGQDDYSSMREVIYRRLTEYQNEKETGEGFGKLPDLILLDGGKGHVSAVLPIVESFNLDIPVFGMVKDSKHKTRAIAADGGEISIASYKSAFSFVTSVQDEVHRYAINYQKNVHKKTSFELSLMRVDGIGEKKAAALLKKYKTKSALSKASVEELMREAKINEKTATELFNFIKEL